MGEVIEFAIIKVEWVMIYMNEIFTLFYRICFALYIQSTEKPYFVLALGSIVLNIIHKCLLYKSI